MDTDNSCFTGVAGIGNASLRNVDTDNAWFVSVMDASKTVWEILAACQSLRSSNQKKLDY